MRVCKRQCALCMPVPTCKRIPKAICVSAKAAVCSISHCTRKYVCITQTCMYIRVKSATTSKYLCAT